MIEIHICHGSRSVVLRWTKVEQDAIDRAGPGFYVILQCQIAQAVESLRAKID